MSLVFICLTLFSEFLWCLSCIFCSLIFCSMLLLLSNFEMKKSSIVPSSMSFHRLRNVSVFLRLTLMAIRRKFDVARRVHRSLREQERVWDSGRGLAADADLPQRDAEEDSSEHFGPVLPARSQTLAGRCRFRWRCRCLLHPCVVVLWCCSHRGRLWLSCGSRRRRSSWLREESKVRVVMLSLTFGGTESVSQRGSWMQMKERWRWKMMRLSHNNTTTTQ